MVPGGVHPHPGQQDEHRHTHRSEAERRVGQQVRRQRHLAIEDDAGQPGPGGQHPDDQRHPVPLNLSAMPSTLIESELFGHKKGAFTGAVGERKGWLAACPRGGAVFLDEIGDLAPMLQVKLPRVLEDRRFTPVGGSSPRDFEGKILAATHVDLPTAIAEGRFGEELYVRLLGDRIDTPSLRDRILSDDAELRRILVALVARSVPADLVEAVTDEVSAAVESSWSADYPWPGNVRELAQCVRAVLVQGRCPPPEAPQRSVVEPLAGWATGTLSVDEVQRSYARQVYGQHGSYKAASQVLGVDWRTVKRWVTD